MVDEGRREGGAAGAGCGHGQGAGGHGEGDGLGQVGSPVTGDRQAGHEHVSGAGGVDDVHRVARRASRASTIMRGEGRAFAAQRDHDGAARVCGERGRVGGADGAGLGLVHHQDVDVGQQRRRHADGGCGVEHHQRPRRAGGPDRGGDRGHRDLQLADQRVAGAERAGRPGGVGVVEAGVRTWPDRDDVLAMPVDQDQRVPGGGAGVGEHPGDVDARRGRLREQEGAVGVGTDPPHQPHESARAREFGRRHGLVGALAAGVAAQVAAEDRLAGRGQRSDGQHQVEVQAAEDHQLARHGVTVPAPP